jgi:hypothetical protein
MSIQIKQRKLDKIAMFVMSAAVVGFLVGFAIALYSP